MMNENHPPKWLPWIMIFSTIFYAVLFIIGFIIGVKIGWL